MNGPHVDGRLLRLLRQIMNVRAGDVAKAMKVDNGNLARVECNAHVTMTMAGRYLAALSALPRSMPTTGDVAEHLSEVMAVMGRTTR